MDQYDFIYTIIKLLKCGTSLRIAIFMKTAILTLSYDLFGNFGE